METRKVEDVFDQLPLITDREYNEIGQIIGMSLYGIHFSAENPAKSFDEFIESETKKVSTDRKKGNQ